MVRTSTPTQLAPEGPRSSNQRPSRAGSQVNDRHDARIQFEGSSPETADRRVIEVPGKTNSKDHPVSFEEEDEVESRRKRCSSAPLRTWKEEKVWVAPDDSHGPRLPHRHVHAALGHRLDQVSR